MAETETEAAALFIGVDGGGTTCRVRLRAADGTLYGDERGGSAQVYLDFEGALATIRATIAAALERAGLGDAGRRRARLGLGLAGVSNAAIAREVEDALSGFVSVRCSNDAVTACLGAHGGGDGGLVIAGTGSAGLALIDGRETFVGGRGFLLGDDGSGARIGLDAWRRALRAHDGLEPHTVFTRALMAEHRDDPAAVIRWGLKARSGDYGAYAPAVFAAAAAGDPVALAVVGTAARAIAELAEAVRRHGAERVALVGGGAEAIRPYLPPEAEARLLRPARDALDGAILLAGGTLPG